MQTTQHKTLLTPLWRPLLALCVMVWVVSGCAGYDSAEAGYLGTARPDAYSDAQIVLAEDSLTRHDLKSARSIYSEALTSNDPFVAGTASAGKAITGMLLLPDDEAMRAMFINELGATNRRYEAQRFLWSNNGILYWFSQGVRWEDDGDFQGVQTIVEDELPWSLERLGSPTAFVQGLTQPGDRIMASGIDVALSLRDIERELERAIEDPRFDFLYLPADVFHANNLAMTLGKSDLAAVHALISFARGAIYFVAAYEHSWTLQGLFSPPQGINAQDHFHEQLDPLLARAITTASHLKESRNAFVSGLFYLERAITLGLEQEVTLSTSPLRWDKIDRDMARDLRDLVRAVANAFDGPSKLPHFDRNITLDLSSFFDSGRTLPAEIPWFQHQPDVTSTEGSAGGTFGNSTGYWVLSEDAAQVFLFDDILSPPLRLDEEYPARLTLDEDGMLDFFEALLGDTQRRLDDAYAGIGLK